MAYGFIHWQTQRWLSRVWHRDGSYSYRINSRHAARMRAIVLGELCAIRQGLY